ncbi:hypothetical protein [Acinetobacter sp. ANC 4648]|uniref:hypothetical protein n=1 Tax=Acinetobacter sp. ANC 4648 TaxID=1977875 RepID=UPI000A3561DB|nr:hypothetical protein [Acinetobacter sp. ANC 4648]OTG83019.1 hypothetical protein B9T27_07040 [Acinetobacter sp. ANC 4648]
MTLQNRIDPWGNLESNPSKKAMLMGNRGVLHNKEKKKNWRWKLKTWISCLTQFKGNKREIFAKGCYSELFFLDEATAFAAGHRPCAECQRDRSQQFKTDGYKPQANRPNEKLKLAEIDTQIHQESITADQQKVTFNTVLANLPMGTCFEYQSEIFMITQENYHLNWSFDGYLHCTDIPAHPLVKVLTPRSIAKAFQQGFTPIFQSTATSALV